MVINVTIIVVAFETGLTGYVSIVNVTIIVTEMLAFRTLGSLDTLAMSSDNYYYDRNVTFPYIELIIVVEMLAFQTLG